MKLNLLDRFFVGIMGLMVSYASYLYAVNGTRAYAIYLLMCVIGSITYALILRTGRFNIAKTLFKGKRELGKHPELRDDIDLI